MGKNKTQKEIIVMEAILKVMTAEFGESAGALYRDYYKGLPLATIIASAGELFIEMMGERKAGEIIDSITSNSE